MTNPFAAAPAPTDQAAQQAVQGGFGAATSPQAPVAPAQQGFAPAQQAPAQQGFGAGTPYQQAAAPATGPAPVTEAAADIQGLTAPATGGGFGTAQAKSVSYPLKEEAGQLIAIRIIKTGTCMAKQGQNQGKMIPFLDCDYAVFTGERQGTIRQDQRVFNVSVVYQAERMLNDNTTVYAGIVATDPSKNNAVTIAPPTPEQSEMVREAVTGQLGWISA